MFGFLFGFGVGFLFLLFLVGLAVGLFLFLLVGLAVGLLFLFFQVGLVVFFLMPRLLLDLPDLPALPAFERKNLTSQGLGYAGVFPYRSCASTMGTRRKSKDRTFMS